MFPPPSNLKTSQRPKQPKSLLNLSHILRPTDRSLSRAFPRVFVVCFIKVPNAIALRKIAFAATFLVPSLPRVSSLSDTLNAARRTSARDIPRPPSERGQRLSLRATATSSTAKKLTRTQRVVTATHTAPGCPVGVASPSSVSPQDTSLPQLPGRVRALRGLPQEPYEGLKEAGLNDACTVQYYPRTTLAELQGAGVSEEIGASTASIVAVAGFPGLCCKSAVSVPVTMG